VNAIEGFCAIKKVTHLYFHIITNFTHIKVDDYILLLTSKLPHQQVIMAGPLTKNVTITHPNLRLLQSLEETLEFSKE
jgi:hypothetical protein